MYTSILITPTWNLPLQFPRTLKHVSLPTSCSPPHHHHHHCNYCYFSPLSPVSTDHLCLDVRPSTRSMGNLPGVSHTSAEKWPSLPQLPIASQLGRDLGSVSLLHLEFVSDLISYRKPQPLWVTYSGVMVMSRGQHLTGLPRPQSPILTFFLPSSSIVLCEPWLERG